MQLNAYVNTRGTEEHSKSRKQAVVQGFLGKYNQNKKKSLVPREKACIPVPFFQKTKEISYNH